MLERYLKAAQYKKVAEVSELADEFTASSKDGLKDVEELLSPGIGEAVECRI